ncbi:divergent PAP2 family protein [Anoxynatronum sibiricum]|uniref:Divergent PAP2 family protein n=1 Tax=Anoxynatronum sibiricum TaxID=210623 RepID=A0ABU9VQ87_9CLOT
MDILAGIGSNRVLWITIIAWFIAQVLKVITTLLMDKHLNLLRLVGSGGMPSSHSSFVMSLATGVGKLHGWDSSIFALSLVFALVVMYDAAGVRYAVGRQAVILNQIIEDFHHHRKDKKLTENRLKELVGHTPYEVFAGAVLGITIAWWLV